MNNQNKVIIADDSKMNREMIAELLGDRYQYVFAENGAELIDYLNNGIDADIILLDINMPVMNGFEVLKIMRDRRWVEEIPVVVISAESDSEFLQKAYSLEATDYLTRPFSAVALRFRVENTLKLYSSQKQLIRLVEEQVLEREEINNSMITIFSRAIEQKNNESGKHTLNIRTISDILLHGLNKLTDRYDLTERKIAVIASLSALHDIGKVSVPSEILNKPGKLTDEEWNIMKSHSAVGDEIIRTSQIGQSGFVMQTARAICRWHHERWDGTGYPDGLAGDDIPIAAQVVSVADVYDALTSDRCYKKAFSHERAVQMILSGECGAFNPLLLRCLADAAPLLEAISEQKSRYDYENEAKVLASEMLRNRDLPPEDRAWRLLESEKRKKEFFKSRLGGIQFEYDCTSQKVSYTDWYAESPTTKGFFLSSGGDIALLSKEDWASLVQKAEESTRENPYVYMTALIPVHGDYRWHSICAKTLWSPHGERFDGVLGQFTDVQDKVTEEGLGNLFHDGKSVQRVFSVLRRLFDVVRLVDPTDFGILNMADDGSLVKTGGKCYEIWHRGECCENCSSCEAYENKGLRTKLEIRGNELYSVISKYLIIDGRECVLEIAFAMAESKAGTGISEFPERTRLLLLNFYKDSLTDTYSRTYLEDFRSGLEKAKAVAVVDIDGFKNINDTYGHLAGDKALRHIAGVIESAVGDRGVVIRYGGDEFLIIFQEIEERDFRSLMKKIKESVHRTDFSDCPDIRVDISVGGAYGAGSLTEAITRADKEMYKDKFAKRDGDDT